MYIYLFIRPQQFRVLGYEQKGPSINIGENIWLNLIIVVCAWRTTVGYSCFNKLLAWGVKLTLNRRNTQVIETSVANNSPSQALTDTDQILLSHVSIIQFANGTLSWKHRHTVTTTVAWQNNVNRGECHIKLILIQDQWKTIF